MSKKSLAHNPIMRRVLDRSCDSLSIVKEILEFYDFDITNRRPKISRKLVTDLDLFSFLFNLASRQAVINIPKYLIKDDKRVYSNQRTVSDENRHGKLLRLGANRKHFGFFIRVLDANVITWDSQDREGVGAYRNFYVVSPDGKLYDGWENIEFRPTRVESDFFEKNSHFIQDQSKIYFSKFVHNFHNQIRFNKFVHETRRNSIFSKMYLINKALQIRLEDEAKYCRTLAKQMREKGIFYTKDESSDRISEIELESPKKQYSITEISVEIPDFSGLYSFSSETPNDLKFLDERAKLISYKLLPRLRLWTKMCELGYVLYSPYKDYVAFWVENMWEEGYKKPKGRSVYSCLKIDEDFNLLRREVTITDWKILEKGLYRLTDTALF